MPSRTSGSLGNSRERSVHDGTGVRGASMHAFIHPSNYDNHLLNNLSIHPSIDHLFAICDHYTMKIALYQFDKSIFL